ncbi:MAG: ATP-binding cassette domain-containing protein [Deltaproteobacteria bacterium]|nr:ATP-binding cassette domain-containing protein [Deltaproteobacteria bacterium]
MATRSALILGSAPGCDLLFTGPGVAPTHAQLSWREGLVLTDLSQGATFVDGRQLLGGETVTLSGWSANIVLGQTPVSLTAPEIALLFCERSQLAADPSGSFVVGRDPARAHVLVAHPGVSGAHARVDLASRTVTDLASTSGTFNAQKLRLQPHQPYPIEAHSGVFFGAVYIASVTLFELAQRGSTAGGFSHGTPPPTARAVSSLPASAGPSISPPAMGASHAADAFYVPTAGVAPVGAAPQKARTMFGEMDLSSLPAAGGSPREAIVGRLPTCDVVLPYPQLSARHASLSRTPDHKIAVMDLGSLNGTYARGVRLQPGIAAIIEPGEKIFVGPYPMVVDLDGTTLRAYIDTDRQEWTGNLVEIEALGLTLEVEDREHKGRQRRLLNEITFKSKPGDLIALMGPSGAGKTTLLTVLNGYLRPTFGEVRVNGENLYAVYEALRGSIGYVPQDDIVHPELTVTEAIRYSARFRLPSDYSDQEIERRVTQVIRDLGLESVKDLEIGKPERKVLSGGQRKRVNIALELVTDPALMFLDEPTSGLAADDTVSLIDLLSNLAKRQGKTIIVTIHQPAREEYEKFNLALIMGYGGEPVYFGPTGRESYEFFYRFAQQKSATAKPIDNPRDMFDQLRHREQLFVDSGQYANKGDARLAAAQAWRAEYFRQDNPTYVRMYTGPRAPGQAGTSPQPTRLRVPLARQFFLLLERYAKVKQRDRSGTAVMLAQAPIIGVLLAAVFHDSAKVPNLWCRMAIERIENAARTAGQNVDPRCMMNAARFEPVQDFGGALFFLAVAAIWFGTSNAAREIVSELAIYRRERMVNLSIFNYVMSKFLLLTGFALVQCTVLLSIVYPIVGLGGGDFGPFLQMLFTMIMTAMCATSVGLLLSTLVTSSEAAMALTPIALIPQVVLGGRLVPMTSKSWLEWAMSFVPARWSFESMIAAERIAVADEWRIPVCVAQGVGIEDGRFQCALEEIRSTEHGLGGLGFATYDLPWVAWAILLTMTVLTLGVVMMLLKRRDPV